MNRGVFVRADAAVADDDAAVPTGLRVASTPYRRPLTVTESRSSTRSLSSPRRTTSSAVAPLGIASRPCVSRTSFSTVPVKIRPSIDCVSIFSVVLT